MIFKNKHSLPENPLHQGTLYTLFLALLIVGAPHYFSLPFWIPTLFIICLGIKFALVKNEKSITISFAPILLAIPVITMVYFQFGTLLGIEASISLLVVMLGLKILELKDYRDAMLCLFLGFFVVVTVFLFHQQLLTVFYLLASGFLLVLALLKLNDFTGKQQHRHQVHTTLKLGLGSVPIILILFFLFPRLDSPLWSLPGNNQQSSTGMSESMMPGQFSKLVKSTAPAFRVNFSGEIPAQHLLYWRGPVLNDFDGRKWSRTKQRPDNDNTADIQLNSKVISYQITIEAQQNRWLFPLDAPIGLGPTMKVNSSGETQAKDVIRKASLFMMSSGINYQLDAQAKTQQLAASLQLPKRVAPRTRALARTLFQQAGMNKPRFVQLVMNRFTEQPYSYTLEPKPMSSDYIDSFMMSTKEGFCEHFSSSFVVMMREVGIPARVVTGYQGGEYNQQGDYLLIRQSDAHAWTEVWLEGQGWVRQDPTSMVSPERVNQGLDSAFAGNSLLPSTIRISFLKNLSLRWDTLNYYWSKWVISYNSSLRTEMLQRFKALMQLIGKKLIVSLTLLAIFITALLALKQLKLRITNRASEEQRMYEKFLQVSKARLGLEKQSFETELQYADRLSAMHPALGQPVTEITGLYNTIRYGHAGREQDKIKLKQLIQEFGNLSSKRSVAAS